MTTTIKGPITFKKGESIPKEIVQHIKTPFGMGLEMNSSKKSKAKSTKKKVKK